MPARPERAGIDYDDLVPTLEQEGVESLADAFTKLLDGIRAGRHGRRRVSACETEPVEGAARFRVEPP